MPVPTLISELSQTPGSNFPLGSESPSVVDDYFRTYAAFIAQHRDGKGYTAEASLASAATTDIGAQNSFFVQITGTTTITSFGTNYNGPRYVRFAGILVLTNSATLLLPGGANITTVAGDRAILAPIGSPATGWQVVAYQRADGLPSSNAVRVDVASSATVSLTASVPSNDNINITGTTTITSFTVVAGRLVFVRFNASLTLTNNASIVTQSGSNITTQAGDTCILRATAANTVEVLSYVPAVLNQQTTRSMVRLHTANGFGSTNTVIRRFVTAATNQGSDITYADSATAGASFTINVPGVYSISYTEDFNAQSNAGISLNSSQLTTSITGIAVADRLVSTTIQANLRASVAWAGYLPAGSVIRPHTAGTAASANDQVTFTIVRVA